MMIHMYALTHIRTAFPSRSCSQMCIKCMYWRASISHSEMIKMKKNPQIISIVIWHISGTLLPLSLYQMGSNNSKNMADVHIHTCAKGDGRLTVLHTATQNPNNNMTTHTITNDITDRLPAYYDSSHFTLPTTSHNSTRPTIATPTSTVHCTRIPPHT